MQNSKPLYSEVLSPIGWYGPVMLAGVLYFASHNIEPIWALLSQKDATESISGSGSSTRSVDADSAVLDITVKTLLASSASEATKNVGSRVDEFAKFVKGIQGVSFSNKPFSVSQEVLQVGEKFANSYSGTQKIHIEFSNFAATKDVIEKAVELNLGDISELVLKLDAAVLKKLRQELVPEALKEAKVSAERKAKDLGKSIGKLVGVQESYPLDEGSADTALSSDDRFDMNDQTDGAEDRNRDGKIAVTVYVDATYEVR